MIDAENWGSTTILIVRLCCSNRHRLVRGVDSPAHNQPSSEVQRNRPNKPQPPGRIFTGPRHGRSLLAWCSASGNPKAHSSFSLPVLPLLFGSTICSPTHHASCPCVPLDEAQEIQRQAWSLPTSKALVINASPLYSPTVASVRTRHSIKSQSTLGLLPLPVEEVFGESHVKNLTRLLKASTAH